MGTLMFESHGVSRSMSNWLDRVEDDVVEMLEGGNRLAADGSDSLVREMGPWMDLFGVLVSCVHYIRVFWT